MAIVDIIGGLVLIFNSVSFVHVLLFYLGWIIFVKGVWALFNSLRKHFYFDYLGLIDIACGGTMLLIFFSLNVSFLWFLGILLLSKGLWSILNAI
ncbi:MAG: DUF308 domain-containing protein [Candidatus Aenigmarchaeota archaeon]|nr:DUF308 domain-containing protein [Candidatus Aenigmarchaeota archaeon]